MTVVSSLLPSKESIAALSMGLKWTLAVFVVCLALLTPTSVLTASILSSKVTPFIYHFPTHIHGKFIPKSEIEQSMGYAEADIGRWERMESNLMKHNVMPKPGSVSYTAMLNSRADDEALKIAKDAYIRLKASEYISYNHCARYGLKNSECAELLSSLDVPCNHTKDSCVNNEYRSLTGECNNPLHLSWGKRYTPYSRLIRPPSYDNSMNQPRGSKKQIPSPIKVSSFLVKEAESPNNKYTMALMGWTNFIGNDLSQTVSYRMLQTGMNIMCCTQDGHWLAPRYQHPLCMPLGDDYRKCFSYVRSMIATPENCTLGPGEQMNAVSHFLDGSSIYGSISDEVSHALRAGEKGQLKVRVVNGDHSMLDYSDEMYSKKRACLLVGDKRVNLDIVSTVLHTLLVREHNRLAAELHSLNEHWSDEKLFQEARRILIAQIQHITYKEWLPLVIGDALMDKYKLKVQTSGYSDNYDQHSLPTVSNEFANAAIRFLSSLVEGSVNLFDEERTLKSTVLLRDCFSKPELLEKPSNFDDLVRGLATQHCQSADLQYSEAVTKYLYSSGNETGADSLSLDIQRGRDHGLSPYTKYRKLFNLPYETFADLGHSISKQSVNKLKKLYSDVHSIDLIVGGMSEEPISRSLLGPVFSNIVAQQMFITQVSDRFFYNNKNQPRPFLPNQLKEIYKSSLARLFCNNGNTIQTMQPKVFIDPGEEQNLLQHCSDETVIPKLNLKFWKETS